MNPNDILNNENLNYGIIGNCKSAALINADSSIDWCCLPQFDSPSIFANILDNDIGGSFKILCDPSYSINQNYCNKTSILITNFSNKTNEFEVLDFMPRYQKESGVYYSPPEIIRFFKLIK
jgi:GH15 family glucan-1,4-alpha-glucosidase